MSSLDCFPAVLMAFLFFNQFAFGIPTFSGFDPFLDLSLRGVLDTSRPHWFSYFIVNTHMMSLYKRMWFVISSFWELGHMRSVFSEFVKREVKWRQSGAIT